MRKDLFFSLFLSLIILTAELSPLKAKVDTFEEWKGRYGVKWTSKEETYRRLIFAKNLLTIEKHNKDPTQTYKMGVNQFTIYTTEEFASLFLTPLETVATQKKK